MMNVGGVSLDTASYVDGVNNTNEKVEKLAETVELKEQEAQEVVLTKRDEDEEKPAGRLPIDAVSAQEVFEDTTQEVSGSRAVYEALLARENTSTGTTEADFQLAEIKISANVKADEETEERQAFFDPTLLAQVVKNDRDFLTGKQAVGVSFDIAQ